MAKYFTTFVLVLSIWCSFIASTYAAEFPDAGVATAAPLKKAPEIDGVIAPNEWAGAVRTPGYLDFTNTQQSLVPRTGSIYFGYTTERFYVAIISELPPDKKLGVLEKNRDADLIWEDSVEMWIDPNKGTRANGQGDLRYYKFMGNSADNVMDVAYNPAGGGPNMGWNAHWTIKSGIDTINMNWTIELSAPWADFGVDPATLKQRTIGLLIARNMKNNWWVQGVWFPHTNSFDNIAAFPAITLKSDVPTVALESLGEKVHTGQMALRARIANPGAARQARVMLHITSSDMPDLTENKVIDLPAGGETAYHYDVPEGRLHEEATHKLHLCIQSPDASVTYFKYDMSWTKAPENKWPGIVTGPRPDLAMKVAYYPSYKFIRVQLDPRELGEQCAGDQRATVVIADARGQALVKKEVSWQNSPYSVEFPGIDLRDGSYAVRVKFPSWKEEINRPFVRKHYPWEGNTLGITDTIYAPFTAMDVKKDTVDVVLRTYKQQGLGFWSSVQAAGNVSAGPKTELLAGPIVLKTSEDKIVSGTGAFTSIKPCAVVYEGCATASGAEIKTRCITEYDGCMKVEMTLLPSKKATPLAALWLEIPLHDAQMPLWHVSTAGLRFNPAGSTPAGNGRVWDSRQFPDGTWFGNFKPYYWLGGAERGLCWFADNDKGWELNFDPKQPEASSPCQELIRKNGVLTLRVNFIQKPVTLTEPRTITFGLMATPAKPMKDNWRAITWVYGYKKNPRIAWLGSEYWGADQDFSSKYPRNHDLSVLDTMRDLRQGKPVDITTYVNGFMERNCPPDGIYRKPPQQLQQLLTLTLNASRETSAGNYLTVYWDEFHSTDPLHEEVNTFQNEWSGTYGYGPVSGLVPSHRDFAVYYAAEFIKRGIGLYFDNSFPKAAKDPLTTSAYRLPNGDIQPSAGMWAHREYLQRIWVLHQELGPKDIMPMMMIHMTNTHIVPYMVWNESNLDLEWFYGEGAAQSRYPNSLLLAESLGRQSGNIPLALAREGTRRTSTMLVHEIKVDGADGKWMDAIYDFGYSQPDCAVYNYWDTAFPVKSSDPQAKTLLLKRGKELLLVLSTWNGQPAKVTLTLDTNSLGVTPSGAWNAFDPKTRYQYDAAAGMLTLDLEGYGEELIRLQ